MRPLALALGLALAALGSLLPSGLGCGPVVAPPDDAGPDADAAPRRDVCQRPDPPAFCLDAGAEDSAASCLTGLADGTCSPGEDCSCADCTAVARCTQKCVDDGACQPAQGEDCSCADCAGKVPSCQPASIGCKDDGVCSLLDDDCTCPDCRDHRDCLACQDDGVCVDYTEGCVCADCAGSPRCQPDAGPAPP